MAEELSNDQRIVMVAAQDFLELKLSPGWRRVLRFMSEYESNALKAIEDNDAVEPEMAFALHLTWRERKRFRDAIISEIDSSIERKKNMIAESLADIGATEQQINEAMEQGEMYG